MRIESYYKISADRFRISSEIYLDFKVASFLIDLFVGFASFYAKCCSLSKFLVVCAIRFSEIEAKSRVIPQLDCAVRLFPSS